MTGILLETLTWQEAEPVLESGRVAVLPVGARLKEHGPHLPLNNDWLTAEYLAKRLLAVTDAIFLPTIPYGFYPAFVEYPGSVTIGLETFRDTVVDIGRSLARHGVTKLYVLNTGISTNRSLAPAKEILAKDGVRMEYTDLTKANKAAKDAVRTQEAGTHADELETSMMLYFAPEVVRMERAVKDVHEHKSGPLRRDPSASDGLYSPTGSYGDPTLATREKGEKLIEGLVAEIASFLREFAST